MNNHYANVFLCTPSVCAEEKKHKPGLPNGKYPTQSGDVGALCVELNDGLVQSIAIYHTGEARLPQHINLEKCCDIAGPMRDYIDELVTWDEMIADMVEIIKESYKH